MLTAETVLKRVNADIQKKREAVAHLQEELGDLMDYLDVISARQRSLGKRTYTQEEMGRRYGHK
jgi:hypothetical protein